GDPRADLALLVDVDELVREVAPDVALEAGDGAVVGDPGVTERVDEEGDVTALLRFAGALRRVRRDAGRTRGQGDDRGEADKHPEHTGGLHTANLEARRQVGPRRIGNRNP